MPLSSHVQWLPYALTLADMRPDGDGGLMKMIMILRIKNIKQNFNDNNNKNYNYDNNNKSYNYDSNNQSYNYDNNVKNYYNNNQT